MYPATGSMPIGIFIGIVIEQTAGEPIMCFHLVHVHTSYALTAGDRCMHASSDACDAYSKHGNSGDAAGLAPWTASIECIGGGMLVFCTFISIMANDIQHPVLFFSSSPPTSLRYPHDASFSAQSPALLSHTHTSVCNVHLPFSGFCGQCVCSLDVNHALHHQLQRFQRKRLIRWISHFQVRKVKLYDLVNMKTATMKICQRFGWKQD